MDSLAVLILAAGKGKRMKSHLPKVVAIADGLPLVQHVLCAAAPLHPERTVIVTGHMREVVEETVEKGANFGLYPREGISFAQQVQQLGTGDAARAALASLEGFSGPVVILYGDVPLLTTGTLRQMIELHNREKATVTIVSALTENPHGYGRIVRDSTGKYAERVVETKDCSPEELQIKEINSGLYVVDSAFLKPALEDLTNDNAQGEYYLTDIIRKATTEGQTVSVLQLTAIEEVLGVNDPVELSRAGQILRRRRLEDLLREGVIFEDPDTAYVDRGVLIKGGARIGPSVQLRGRTQIEEEVVIEGNAYLVDTTVHRGARVKFGVRTESSTIGERAQVGPFAHLRPGSELGEEVKIGNFVETKKASLAKGAAASHLTYLGDCEVGEGSNIGAGVITCNYDGAAKHKTIIEANVFVGSNSSLVAPVTVEEGSTIGAGSTITKKVAKGTLALTRAALVVKEGYIRKTKKN